MHRFNFCPDFVSADAPADNPETARFRALTGQEPEPFPSVPAQPCSKADVAAYLAACRAVTKRNGETLFAAIRRQGAAITSK